MTNDDQINSAVAGFLRDLRTGKLSGASPIPKPPPLSPAFLAEIERVGSGTRAGMLAMAARLEAGLAAAEGMAPEKRRAMVRVVAWLRERAG